MNIFNSIITKKKKCIFPLLGIGIFLLSSCVPDGAVATSRSEYYHNKDGYVLHLMNGIANYKYKDIEIDAYTDLKNGLMDAVKEINRFTSLKFSIEPIYNFNDSNFVINTTEESITDENGNAVIMRNNFFYKDSNGELYRSTITVSLPALKSHLANRHDIKLLFMHEFGHTLGLKHVKAESMYNPGNPNASNPSIMYPYYDGWNLDSYTNLDREVIISVYQGSYNQNV